MMVVRSEAVIRFHGDHGIDSCCLLAIANGNDGLSRSIRYTKESKISYRACVRASGEPYVLWHYGQYLHSLSTPNFQGTDQGPYSTPRLRRSGEARCEIHGPARLR